MNKKWISMVLAMGILVVNLPVVNTFAEDIKSTSIEGTTTVGAGNITTDTSGTTTVTTDTVGQDKMGTTTVTTDTTGTGTVSNTKVEDSTSTAGEEKINNSDFVFDKGTGTIILYKGNAKVLTIPSEIDGVAVKRLSSRTNWITSDHLGMFTNQNRDKIEKVIIPSSVEIIHDETFSGCKNLKEVELSEGLKKIGDYAFSYTALEKINIPSSVIEVGYNCVYDTPWEKSTMDKNSGLLIINNKIYDVAITDKLGSQAQIYNSKFEFDKSTGTITGYKGNATGIYIPSEIDGVSVLNIEASPELKAKGYGILGDNLTVSRIEIGSTKISIKSGAFKNSINLKSVCIDEEKIQSIESGSFQGCINLSDVRNWANRCIAYKDVYKDAFKDTEWQLEGAIATDTLVAAAGDTADDNNAILAILIIILSGIFVYKSYKLEA